MLSYFTMSSGTIPSPTKSLVASENVQHTLLMQKHVTGLNLD